LHGLTSPLNVVILILIDEKHTKLPVAEIEKSSVHSPALADERGVYRPAARKRRARLITEINAGWSEKSERALSAIAKHFGLKS